MQEKLLNKIRETVENHGLEFQRVPIFANTGRIFVMNDFDSVLGMYYDFQDNYCKVQIYPANVEVVGTVGFTHPDCIFDWHGYYHKEFGYAVGRLLSFIDTRLCEIKEGTTR